MKNLISTLIVIALLGISGQLLANTNGQRPNFLVVVADDLGWTDIASFGSEIKTPNIDSLAAEGVKFTDFYVSVSCSPTRSKLMRRFIDT